MGHTNTKLSPTLKLPIADYPHIAHSRAEARHLRECKQGVRVAQVDASSHRGGRRSRAYGARSPECKEGCRRRQQRRQWNRGEHGGCVTERSWVKHAQEKKRNERLTRGPERRKSLKCTGYGHSGLCIVQVRWGHRTDLPEE